MKTEIRTILRNLKLLDLFPKSGNGEIVIKIADKRIIQFDKIENSKSKRELKVFVKSITINWIDTRTTADLGFPLHSGYSTAEITIEKNGRIFEVKYWTDKVSFIEVEKEALELFK